MPSETRKKKGHLKRRPSFIVALINQSWNVFSNTLTPFWKTVIVALVKAMSVIAAAQLSLGHPPCVPVIGPGSFVVTQKETAPFLI